MVELLPSLLRSSLKTAPWGGSFSLPFIRFAGAAQHIAGNLTLSTLGANPLSVLPPRRRTGARVEPFLSGVTAVKAVGKLGREEGKGLGLPIPIGPHKGRGAVERFHIAEPKGSTSLRDRSISPPLVPAAFHSIYALFPGIGGSILPMLSHGLVPSALFLCVGVLYDRHQTRLVRYYGGSVSTMPNLSTISFSFTLANMSLPGTSSFIGEFPISVGAFQRNSLVATLAALGMILGAAYSLWLYNRVVSGNCKPDFLHKFSDPNGREVLAMGRMRLPSVGLGGIARCRSPPLTISLVFREPKLDFTKKKRLAQEPLNSRKLKEGAMLDLEDRKERKDGGQGCMVLLDPVSEGQLKERLMNAAGLDEPITLRPSVSFLSKNHSLTATWASP
ncbi:NADH-quinone oxidoreductase protein [Cucumis melo var. makuwa]|uniref:NADH-ubiquinone oxidoreductase chain 4 n=1 Tax=Cucumis melo var. makuwa TaxID=1194695 RepID=A0A5A7UB26_CUCMM|nr:NADH-quinone oxidoreductase protein [Cucumis melo var. makuwa]